MKRAKRERAAAAGLPPAEPPRETVATMLGDPEARVLLAAIALHGMLAGKTALPIPREDLSQDERRADAAARLAKDAWSIADAMIAEGSK